MRNAGIVLALALVVPALAGAQANRAQSAPAEHRVFSDLSAAERALRTEAADRDGVPRARLLPPTKLVGNRVKDLRFQVTAPAYVLVVAVDHDRRVHVVFPSAPSDVGFASPDSTYATASFDAGAGPTTVSPYRLTGAAVASSATPVFERLTPFEGGGVLVAIASARPLQLDRVGDGASFDLGAIERLLYAGTVGEGAERLGEALVVEGQRFSADVRYLTEGPLSPVGQVAVTCDRAPHSYVDGTYRDGSASYVRLVNVDPCGRSTVTSVQVQGAGAQDSAVAAAMRANANAAAARMPASSAPAITPKVHKGN